MAIPNFQKIMLPLLKLSADDQEHTLKSAIESLAPFFKLTLDEMNQLLPSGTQPVFANRVGWAKSYLKMAGLVESPKRGIFKITPRGHSLLATNPPQIDSKLLEQFPEFLGFQQRASKERREDAGNEQQNQSDTTPDEAMETAYRQLREQLAQELLAQMKTCSPAFFERTVVDLLLAMGYGGSRREAGATIGKSGDGGIDGIIKEDKLGLDVVYIQAKRWDAGTVGRPDIQKFAGALQGQRAKKGVFITTSAFTKEAREFASFIDTRIVLIDGEQLAQLMIDHGVGVTTTTVYELKRLDSDYFAEG
ncbi:MAG: restriction endonuclease [Pseudomonadota bacterium]